MRGRRALLAAVALATVVPPVVAGSGPAPPAGATTASGCALDSASGTLTITTVVDRDEVANSLTIARTPTTGGDPGSFQVSGDGFAGVTDCGGATVENVDTAVVKVERGFEVQPLFVGLECESGGGFDRICIDPFTLTLDLSNGPFAPGRKPSGGQERHRDLFAAGGEDDDVPEIEFDVHLPNTGRAVLSPHTTLTVVGTDGPDHVAAGSSTCPSPEDPRCRSVKVNLNANQDDDADVLVVAGAGGEGLSPLATLTVDGGAGNDMVTVEGGAGTGDLLTSDLVVTGGDGDDAVVGGLGSDTLSGGFGNDLLSGGGGDDHLSGDTGDDLLAGDAGDDVVSGGAGDDVINEGLAANGTDDLQGGDGRDVVDYSRRSARVDAAPGDNTGESSTDLPDDGEVGEHDTVRSNVEEVLLPGSGATSGFRVVGEMEALSGVECNAQGTVDSRHAGPCALVIDPVRSLGFSVGKVEFDNRHEVPRLRVYDLDTRKPVREIPCEGAACPTRLTYGTIDPVRSRLYVPPRLWGTGTSDSTANLLDTSVRRCELVVVDYTDVANLTLGPPRPYDCPPESANLVAISVAAVPDGSGLLISGAPKEEFAARRPSCNFAGCSTDVLTDWPSENLAQPLLVRRLDLDAAGSLAYRWDLDLRGAGCGRRVQFTRPSIDPIIPPFVTVVGSDLVAYCWDPKPVYWNRGMVGEPGYVVRIPLDPQTGRPLGLDGRALPASSTPYTAYRSVRTPTLPGYLRVLSDPGSGLLMLVTDDRLNGNAVWLFDPRTDRFVGVVTGGAADQPPNNVAVGLDPTRGRTYLLTQDGLLMAPTRQRPLPAGVVYPVAANAAGRPGWANLPVIGVAPKLRRLFLPLNLPDQAEQGARYLVVDDEVPDPPPSIPADPDANTTQVDEGEGTEASVKAEGSASGMRVLVTGGATRTVNTADPGCTLVAATGNTDADRNFPLSLESQILGTCLGDLLVAAGHREATLAATSAETGTASLAVGAPLAFASEDVTGTDLRRAGDCEAAALGALTRGEAGPLVTPYREELCDPAWNGVTGRDRDEDGKLHDSEADTRDPRRSAPDPREGTRGRDGQGFPLPASSCGDFGGGGEGDSTEGVIASAAVSCDAASTRASSTASAAAFALAVPEAPPIAVARAASSVVTERRPDGQVTVAAANAEGVQVGPVSIREVRSVAVTRAKGRTGTAVADLERRWCGITVAGDEPTDTAWGSVPQAQRDLLLRELRALAEGTGCIDPTHPDNAALIETLNALLGGKVRLGVTPANGPEHRGEASPGGYQAVIIKDEEAQGGDQVVNDDDGVTVAGLEATVYNDGVRGRNRYVVQLAGVHAESRYGVTLLPRFSGFEGSFAAGSLEATPSSRRVIPGTRRAPSASVIIEGEGFEDLFSTAAPLPEDSIRRFLGFLPEALGDLWRLFVQHPLEFLLLFFVFSLLGTPAYLAYRRRTFVGVVAG